MDTVQFKKDYNTEKKIVADLDSRNGSLPWLADETEKIKKGLFDLMHVSSQALDSMLLNAVRGSSLF